MSNQARQEVTPRPGESTSTSGQTGVGRGMMLGYIFAIGSALSYSVTQVLTRQNIDKLGSPIVGVVFTVFFGALVLWLMNFRSMKPNFKEQQRGWVYFAIAGIFANLGVTCLFFALRSSPIVVVSPVISINPLITLVLAHLFLQRLEKITLRIYLGALLVVIGVIIIALSQGR